MGRHVMPKIVDHDERRAEIARAVEAIVHETGIISITMRDVAKRLGCAPSVISHYFETKLEMLVFTVKQVRARAETALIKALDEGRDFHACFEILLPTDEQMWRNWHMCFAFWGLTPNAHPVQREWEQASHEANLVFQRIIARAQERQEVDASLDPASLATDIQVIINGIASLVNQSRKDWPPARQRTALRTMMSALLQPV
jgi:AcrR family transcriptional regulator